MQAAMDGANKEVDPDGDDRKGGSAELAKCFLSCDEAKYVNMLFYVPKALEGDMTLKDWAAVMVKDIGGIESCPLEECGEDDKATWGRVQAHGSSEKQLFPLKMRDAAINCSFAELRARDLVAADDSGSEEDLGGMYEDAGIEW